MINECRFAEPIKCAMFLNTQCDVLVGHGKYVSLLRNTDYFVFTQTAGTDDLIRVAQKVDNERMHQLKMKDEVMRKGTEVTNFQIISDIRDTEESSISDQMIVE